MTKKKAEEQQRKGEQIVKALTILTKEKEIKMDVILESLEEGLKTAAQKYLGRPVRVEVDIDNQNGTIEVYTLRTVVEEVENPEEEIEITEARQIDASLEVGDELVEELDIAQFGRIAIQNAKQVVNQKVHDAEREKVYEDYSGRIGELVTGKIQKIDRGNLLVNIGRTEAVLPYREQIRKERHRQGETIRGCIVEVRRNTSDAQVILSRVSSEFLAKLFELEVPEIFDKTISIVKVVRDPGRRSKIAVTTSDDRVDPVGACVGMRGNRVQSIVRELSNERIDIINWTPEISMLVRRVFAPAEIKRVHEVGKMRVVVIVQQEDLAQCIGKEGQNIKLASRLIEREIDVFGDEEHSKMSEEEWEKVLQPKPEELQKEQEDELEEESEQEGNSNLDNEMTPQDDEEADSASAQQHEESEAQETAEPVDAANEENDSEEKAS